MGTRNKVVVGIEPEERQYSGPWRAGVLKEMLELREWCHTNLKDPWRTYELRPGGGVIKFFFVFEFESKKDEMLFRLYTGK